MIVWVVSGANQIFGVFTTERKAKAYAESLGRNKYVTYVTKITLNNGVQKSDT